ncbi:MAG: glycoside hydrolase family 13 protein [Ornithinimicrobium sp.]
MGNNWIDQPHHDGSSLYVSTQTPELGDVVQVRLRVPGRSAVDEVHVRLTPDGEQEFVSASRIEGAGGQHDEGADQWWQAELRCHNPVTHYRFLLSRSPSAEQSGQAGQSGQAERSGDTEGSGRRERAGGRGLPAYQWVNGTGVHDRDVPDAADFRLVTFATPPAWAAGSVVYQIFPDRFARDASVEPEVVGGPRTDLPGWAHPAAWDDRVDLTAQRGPQQIFGGTLEGVTQHLDHVEQLGATVVYLTPFFPARSNHRYDAASFDEVDPILGGTPALLDLQRSAHERGLMVMGDITTNHTGEEHEWFGSALVDPTSPEAGWFVRHHEADRDDGYVSWLAVGSLPKLDHSNLALRAAMFDQDDGVIRRWLGPTQGLDAWRVDVANMTGRYRDTDVAHDVARQVRRAVDEVGDQRGCAPLLIAEHTHDHSGDAVGDGWHGVMNYSGFTRPLWTWLRHDAFSPKFLGSPVRVPRLGGDLVAETMREFAAIVPWRTTAHSFTLLGSHDTTRVRTLVGDDLDLVAVAAGLLFTMPGIPMVTYGDEIGMRGDFGEDGRRPMPWLARGSDSARWDDATLQTYRSLIAARRSTPALHTGGLRWLHTEEDAMVFLREHPSGTALVHIARDAHAPIHLPAAGLPGVDSGRGLVGPAIEVTEEGVTLAARGPTVRVWLWEPPVPCWAS